MKKIYFIPIFLFFGFCALGQTIPTGSSAEVGETGGQLTVSLSGGANYAIPIKVPPGINGVEPQISLVYDSQSGNGSAGYGWNIGGLSTISRIPSTKFHDGNAGTIKYSIEDKYALDGQRLIVKSGTNGEYGRDGTVYETENFSNAKITSYGAQSSNGDNGPAYFKVEYPDGSKAYYGYISGNSSNSLSQIHYALTYWENPQGIRISYFYNITLFDKLMLTSIKYGSKNDDTPPNEINFIYKNRALNDIQIIAGDYKRDLVILSEINVKTNGIGFRNYFLGHDLSSSKYERLTSITEKSGDNSKSLNPTVFSYVENQGAVGMQMEWSRKSPGISLTSSDGKILTADFDGDGEAEFISAPSSSQIVIGKINEDYTTKNTSFTLSNSDKRYAINSLDSNFGISSKQNLCIAVTENNLNKYKIYSFNSSLTSLTLDYEKTSPISEGYPSKDLYGDFDGDYLTDLLVLNEPVNGICSLKLINLDRQITSNFISSAGQIDIGIWNDNGSGQISGTHIIKIADINGDGKSDIVIFRGAPYNDILGYTLKNNTFEKFIEWDYNIPGDIGDTSHYSVNEFPVLVGDYNGDGKSDIFLVATGKILISTGGLYFSEEVLPATYSPPTYPYTPYEQIVAFDFNNDGRSDIIRIKPGRRDYTPPIPNSGVYLNQETLEVFLWSNTRENSNQWGFQNFYRYVFPYPYGNFYNSADPDPYLVDITALVSRKSKLSPNKAELAVNVGGKVVFLSNNSFSTDQHLLRSITTGNGVKEDITYSSLKKDNGVYEAGAVKPYPYLAIQNSPEFKVVSQIDYPSNEQSKKVFKYFDAVNNVEGLGFMGFQAVLRTNLHNSTVPVISNVIKNNYLLRGANVENYSVDGLVVPSAATPGSFISKSVLEYNSPVDALQSNKVFKLKNIGLKQYDGLTNTSSEISTGFDSFNNPLTAAIIIKEGASVVQTSIKNLSYDAPTLSPYIVGRPNSKTESVSYNNDTALSEEVYTYNSQQLLSQVKKRPDGTVGYITEDNIYDSFGNLTSKTITAGANSRTTGCSYDTSGRLLLTKTDIESLQTVFTYYPNGTLKTLTNPYGQTLTYEYDSWFRKIKTTDYLQKIITYSYTKDTGNNTTILSSVNSDGTASSDIYNALGQIINEKVKANVNGLFISKHYFYDINGRIIEEGVPHYPYSIRRTLTQYDVYGRIIKHQGPESSGIGTGTVISYSGLLSTLNDGTLTKTVKKDAVGNIIEVNDGSGQLITYGYFANGNLRQSSCGGVNISIIQDKWGRRTQLTDPSAGIVKYTYNDFNELTQEENSNGITTYSFSPLGRLEEKTIIGSNTNSKTVYSYDAGSKKISSSLFTDYFNGGTTITNTYFYDSWKRLYKVVEAAPYATFTKTFAFDSFGRVDTETSAASSGNKASSKTLKRTYQNGAQYQILDGNTVLWQKDNVNDNGELLSGVFGNGTNVRQDYNGNDYMINNDYRLGTTSLLKMETSFNVLKGNLESRNNSLFNYTEEFKYDNMNRLTDITATNQYMNCTFSTSDVEGFQGENGGSVVSSAGGLSVAIPNANGAVKRSLLTGKSPGDELTVRFDIKKVLGTDTFNVYIQEQDPVTLASTKYFKGTLPTSATGTVMNLSHTVVQYPNVNLRIEKVNTTSINVFILDNVTGGQKSKTLQTYDVKGRITSNELGWYNYPSSGKIYQNSSINVNPSSVAYYQSRPTQLITYNTFKSPYQIEDTGIDKISFEYNDDNGRSAMFYGSTQDKLLRPFRKYYSGDGTMEVKQNTLTGGFEFLTYIGGDAYTAPIVLKSDGTNENYLYLQRDFQGSIMAVASNTGTILERRLFDPWGGILSVQNGAGTALSGLTILDRGYTGHEHLQSVGIIHMNGRLYDPKLRRFLQPDNNIQDPLSVQNYNRYAYVMNNPLKYTDQSGEFWNVVFGYLFSAYVHGAYSNGGELNPFKWNSIGFINAASSTVSLGASNVATNFTNNYLDNYNKPPELGINGLYDKTGFYKNKSIMYGDTEKSVTLTNDNIDFLTAVGVGSWAGNFLRFKEMYGYTLDKSGFLIGTYSPKNAIDLTESILPGQFNIYEKEYVESLSKLKVIGSAGKIVAKGGYYLGYLDGLNKASQGDLAGGAASAGSNYAADAIGTSYGWGYGLAFQLTWVAMDKHVSQTEWYNRFFFGKDSDTYRERGISNGWYFDNWIR
ncbi:RHS repeat-associated core domain-containing protein [Flavobacterium sp. S87F.05.LMB.W.Kidney.N]|uniref:RHS repeat-associated core domain-containing protein n=1 Tax=Flavobacterium sp. S87F.05.LMB.W.Kidney.N TaxID=1278758 RepID=UPI0010665398|nr:RHS repeat-associated core domain-containing protein [Flavobacterium sp. S87F.05.LMB.W.Kidney.N]TDX11254.1 RHS repeat-associated protein [Flavobacterium sp. S87F.05.LMB.W.Kidney.N]